MILQSDRVSPEQGEIKNDTLANFCDRFFAELGDKTQLATLLFAADKSTNKVGVFAAAAAALVLSRLIAVLVGSQLLSLYLTPCTKAGRRGRFHWDWYLGVNRFKSLTLMVWPEKNN